MFTACEDEAHGAREARDERLAKPGIEETENFVVIESENDASADGGEAFGGVLGGAKLAADGGRKRVEEALLGRFDGAAIEGDDGGAMGVGALGKFGEEARFADAADAMQEKKAGAVLASELREQRKFQSAAHERALCPIGENGCYALLHGNNLISGRILLHFYFGAKQAIA
jgi:hypothetical protein